MFSMEFFIFRLILTGFCGQFPAGFPDRWGKIPIKYEKNAKKC